MDFYNIMDLYYYQTISEKIPRGSNPVARVSYTQGYS
jgi:hypothetical protein